MTKKEIKFITKYGVNISNESKNKILIGREYELRSIMQTLIRREKSCPMLVGYAGTGKTAIVQGLCNLINQNKVPNELRNYTIYSISINNLEAGTRIQGELEERVENLFSEAAKYKDSIILFIDEIHTILNNIKIANVIKTYITSASGGIKCIGATTLDEYRKFIEPDTALKRRFNMIFIDEPGINETIKIVRGVKHQLENFYHINIPDKIIQKTASISKRYWITQNNPDLTLEILDDTASRLKFERELEPDSIAKIAKQIIELKLEIEILKIEEESNTRIENLTKELEILENQYSDMSIKWEEEKSKILQIMDLQKKIANTLNLIEEHKNNYNLVEAGRLRYVDLPKYKNELKLLEDNSKFEFTSLNMTVKDILNTVSKKTGIGIEQLSYNTSSISELRQFLSKNIFGQNTAINTICSQLKRVWGGFRNMDRPISVMCFVGPSGVGKTRMAQLLSEFLFQNKDCLKIINMAQYSDRHHASALFGTTAGYVGYKDEGILTGAVRNRPYQVILFKSIEKAHPQIIDQIIEIISNGVIEDSAGRVTNFREAKIIFTITIPSSDRPHINNDDIAYDHEVIDDMMRLFKAEFVDKMHTIVRFNQINRQYYPQIIIYSIEQEILSFKSNTNISIVIDDEVYNFLYNLYLSAMIGIREITKVLETQLYNKIIDIACEISESDKKYKYIYVCIKSGSLNIQIMNKSSDSNVLLQ
ncbi:ATP-dependent Clp protease ATP-binding protein [uncultured bacterium]|nr:ATP-dependent Clp protease ATP-binding protein [uncultured bacterium]